MKSWLRHCVSALVFSDSEGCKLLLEILLFCFQKLRAIISQSTSKPIWTCPKSTEKQKQLHFPWFLGLSHCLFQSMKLSFHLSLLHPNAFHTKDDQNIAFFFSSRTESEIKAHRNDIDLYRNEQEFVSKAFTSQNRNPYLKFQRLEERTNLLRLAFGCFLGRTCEREKLGQGFKEG